MNELNKDQQSELVTHLREVMKGERPMDHPGAPSFRHGQKYEPNSADQAFEAEMRTGLFRNAFFRSLFWGATPAILFNIPQVRASWLFRNSKSPVPAIILCGFLGYGKGILEGSNQYAKERFQLEGSPISKETRWKVYEMNPSHSWLRGFEHEFDNVNRRAQMESNRRGGGRYDDYPPRRYDDRYNDRYDDRRFDSGMHPDSHQDDGFSMDDWFQNGSEGGRIPGSQSDDTPRRNPYIDDRRSRFQDRDDREDMSKGDRYRQDRREFERNRDREEVDRTRVHRNDSYTRYNDPPRSSRPRGHYGQRDEDFVTQADFQEDDDKFVSGRPNRDGW